MKLHPLRVGNVIVDFEDSPYYFRVEKVYQDRFVYRKSSHSYVIDDHRIELSEPILLALGFEKTKEQQIEDHVVESYLLQHFEKTIEVSENGKIELMLNISYNEDGADAALFIEDNFTFNASLSYLDQLQNIIFDLFGVDIVEDETKLPL